MAGWLADRQRENAKIKLCTRLNIKTKKTLKIVNSKIGFIKNI